MFRINVIIVILSLILISTTLLAQYDQKQVMMNQIRRLEARREFSQANRLYEDLVDRYPNDSEVISGYFHNLVNLNRTEDAGNLLEENKNLFAPEVLVQLQITLHIRKGEAEEAQDIGLNYLRRHRGNVNLYRTFANIYERERQSETAVEVLEMARRNTRDDYLYAMEMARNHEILNNYPESIREYIKHLEKNPGFLHFINNRIKTILDNDNRQITTLRRILENSENEILLEIFALALSHVGEYQEAFEVYKRLDPDKMIRYADELFAAGNVDLAREGYEIYRLSIDDPVKSAEVGIKIALLYIAKNDLQQARIVLSEIRDDRRIQDRQIRFRTRANRQARELLADIAIRLDEPKSNVIAAFEEAKQFAFNRNEQREIDLKVTHYLIMRQEYQQAQNMLESILRDEPSGSQITNYGHYYKFMLALMEQNSPSDSLLTEMIIAMPGSDFTNEALFLMVVFHEMNPQVRMTFLEAYRLKSLYKDEEALAKLLSLEDNVRDEEIILITAQWALEAGENEIAEQLFSHEFRDDTLAGYALLKLNELRDKEHQKYRDLLTNFLKDHPTHIFSPKFRVLLTSRQPSRTRRPD